VILYDVFSVDEVYNKALKIERLQTRATPFKHSTPIEESASGAGVQSSFTMIDHCQLVSRLTPLQQHQQQLQRAERIPTPSLGLASAIGVESLDTDLMNVLRESKSIWQVIKMTERKRSKLKS